MCLPWYFTHGLACKLICPKLNTKALVFLKFSSFTFVIRIQKFPALFLCVSWMIRSKPAGRNPLWFFLSMLYSCEQIHAWILQIIVHNHAVKELTVLALHGPACFLDLLKVFILRKPRGKYWITIKIHEHTLFLLFVATYRSIIIKKCTTRNIKCISYMKVSLNVAAGKKMWVFSCLPHAFRGWRPHKYDVGLQLLGSDWMNALE